MSQIKINTNERAVSRDINRLQTMGLTGLEEVFRWMSAATLAVQAAGVAEPAEGSAAPPISMIMNGIMGDPQIGVSDVLVKPGLMFMSAVDSPVDPDASPFKLIIDPGVQALGQLLVLPNTSGQVRIDVLECQRNPSVVLEVDSRDIFDVSSGLFNAATVDKVLADQLTYRIRQSTPGAGYDGNQAGWLPLMICVVPNGFATNDDVAFFDVRPMWSDLASSPFSIDQPWVGGGRQNAQLLPDAYTGNRPSKMLLQGIVDTSYGPSKLGGMLSPDAVTVDVLDPFIYQEEGFTWPSHTQGLWFVWLMTFYGLPRWARYSHPIMGVRAPITPRGMLVLSHTPPDRDGNPSEPINAPLGFVFTGEASVKGALAIAGTYQTLGHSYPIWGGVLARDGEHTFSTSDGPLADQGTVIWQFPLVSGYGPVTIVDQKTTFTFNLADNVTHPFGAATVKLRIAIGYDFGSAPIVLWGGIKVSVDDQSDGSATNRPYWSTQLSFGAGGALQAGVGNQPSVFDVEVPLTLTRDADPGDHTVKVQVPQQGNAFGAGEGVYSVTVTCLGWTFQP